MRRVLRVESVNISLFPPDQNNLPTQPTSVKQAAKSFPSRYIVPPKGFKPKFTFSYVIKSVDDK